MVVFGVFVVRMFGVFMFVRRVMVFGLVVRLLVGVRLFWSVRWREFCVRDRIFVVLLGSDLCWV